MHKYTMKAAKFVLAAVLLSAIAGAAAIAVAGLRDDVQASDVAVVLGSKVELTGRPSARLAARLERAVALHAAGTVREVIVSGGVGVEGFDEAAVMRDYLVGAGVPAAAIILDSAGNNTAATARNCALLMKARGFTSAVVVTQFFHIPRSRLALRASGVEQVRAAHADYFELRDIYSTAREVVALPAYWFSLR